MRRPGQRDTACRVVTRGGFQVTNGAFRTAVQFVLTTYGLSGGDSRQLAAMPSSIILSIKCINPVCFLHTCRPAGALKLDSPDSPTAEKLCVETSDS